MHTPAPATNRKALGILLFIVFLDLLGASLIVPVAPYLVRQYREDALAVAVLNLSYSAAQFVGAPVLGVLSDRFGRRPVLLLSLLGSAIGYFMFGWAGSLWMLNFSRVLDGVSGGNIAAAQAYIADMSAPHERAKNFGLIGAAFGLGFVLGPVAGGALSRISLQSPAFAAGILTLLTLGLTWLLLPESLPEEHRTRTPLTFRSLNPLGQIGRALAKPELRLLLVSVFFLNFAFSGLTTNFAVYTLVRFGLGPGANALLFAWIGAVVVITQGLLVRRWVKSGREGRFAVFGSALLALGFLAVAATPTVALMYGSVALTALGAGFYGPAVNGLLSQRVSSSEQGYILGVAQSLASLTRVLGPLWAGLTFDLISPTAPYWTGAAWIALSCLLAIAALRRHGHTPPHAP